MRFTEVKQLFSNGWSCAYFSGSVSKINLRQKKAPVKGLKERDLR
jgi:hypothetical protein